MKKKAEERPTTRPLDQALIQDLPQGAPGHNWGSEGAPGTGGGGGGAEDANAQAARGCCAVGRPCLRPILPDPVAPVPDGQFKPTQNRAASQSDGTVLSAPTLPLCCCAHLGLKPLPGTQ